MRTLRRPIRGSLEKQNRPYQDGLAIWLFMCKKAFSVCYGFATDNCIPLRLEQALRSLIVIIATFSLQQLVYFYRRSGAVFFQTHRRKHKSKDRYYELSQVMTNVNSAIGSVRERRSLQSSPGSNFPGTFFKLRCFFRTLNLPQECGIFLQRMLYAEMIRD